MVVINVIQVDTYQKATVNIENRCLAVQEKYEADVNKFGYSLKDFRRVKPTDFVRPFLLPSQLSEMEDND